MKVRVVHIRVPAVETQGLPVPGTNNNVVIRHRIEVGRPLSWIVPAPSLDLLRRGVEHIENVRRLPVGHLDTKRVDKDEPINAMGTRDRDFRGQPAAEGQSHKRDRVVGSWSRSSR